MAIIMEREKGRREQDGAKDKFTYIGYNLHYIKEGDSILDNSSEYVTEKKVKENGTVVIFNRWRVYQ